MHTKRLQDGAEKVEVPGSEPQGGDAARRREYAVRVQRSGMSTVTIAIAVDWVWGQRVADWGEWRILSMES